MFLDKQKDGLYSLPSPKMDSPLAKVMVVIAPRENPNYAAMLSVYDMCKYASTVNIETVLAIVLHGAPGFQNLSSAIHAFMNTDCTHIFVTADDIKFAHSAIQMLIEDNKDIVGCVYRTREAMKINPAGYTGDMDEFYKDLKAGALKQVEFVRGHGMMIKRHVIEKMINDYPELGFNILEGGKCYALSVPIIENGRLYQDDFAFSLRASRSGFTLWDDYRVRCAHLTEFFAEFPDVKSI